MNDSRPAGISHGRAMCAAIALAAVLLWLQAPLLPGAGLDLSWIMALEHANETGLLFGRDFIFTFGPFAGLATQLFAPETYGYFLAAYVFLTIAALIPLSWTQRPWVLALFGAAVLAAALDRLSVDGRVTAGFLGVFLLAMRNRGWWPVIMAAACGPILLSKLTYVFGALPLFVLADAARALVFRRPPLMTAAAIGVAIGGLVALGYPLAQLPDFIRTVGTVIAGYGQAMQYALGGILPLFGAYTVLIAVAAWVLLAILNRLPRPGEGSRLRWLMIGAGVAWTLYYALKTGYVRQDLHMLNTWFLLALVLAQLAAFFDAERALVNWEKRSAAALMAVCLVAVGTLDAVYFALDNGVRPLAYIATRARELAVRPVQTLSWLLPGTWQQMTNERARAERALAAEVPSYVRGSADAIPSEIAPLIAAGVYRPRPTPQSYSAYTPGLQALDRAHFADSNRAPEWLFVKDTKFDDRWPTLALGPSLPVLLQWYEAVNASSLGVVLKRRASPLAAIHSPAGTQSLRVGEWINVPQAPPHGWLFARVNLPQNLLGSAAGLITRSPIVSIEVRFADGAVERYRFVPAMAELGFLLSPVPKAENNVAGTLALFTGRADLANQVRRPAALRITPDAAVRVSYDEGSITFSTMTLPRTQNSGTRSE